MTPKYTRLRFLGALAALAGAVFVPALCLAETKPAPAPAKTAKKTVRLLTVGNSFSGNATEYLGKIAQAAGNVLIQHSASIGGGTMAQHWKKVEQHEKEPQDPRGFYTSKRTLTEELVAEPWDIVTIQQASIVSHDISTYRPYAAQLRDFIKKLAPKAEVVVHQTWAYRRDDPRFTKPSSAPRPTGDAAGDARRIDQGLPDHRRGTQRPDHPDRRRLPTRQHRPRLGLPA